MNSLEIVNRNIKAIKKLLYKLKDVQEGTNEDFEKYYHEQELKDFKIIKQDLEVLEIIKKHLEIYIWQNIFSKEHELELDIILKHIDNEEERYKVKQWFDEQNERG